MRTDFFTVNAPSIIEHVLHIASADPVAQEISSITERGNVPVLLSHLAHFSETGALLVGTQGASCTPALLISLPHVQATLMAMFPDHITKQGLHDLAERYLTAYKTYSVA
jgi:hypothetical protein